MALVNCLNFGNPEHPEVMWQLSEAIDGMAAACAAFDLPVIGGNVSLYNESSGTNIDPTPIVGVVGLIDELREVPPGLAWSDGDRLVLLGPAAGFAGGEPLGVRARPPRWRARARSIRRWSTPWPVSCGPRSTLAWCRPSTTSPPVALGVCAAEMAIAAGVGLHPGPGPRPSGAVRRDARVGCSSPCRPIGSASSRTWPRLRASRADGSDSPTAIASRSRVSSTSPSPTSTAWRDRLPDALGSGTTQG